MHPGTAALDVTGRPATRTARALLTDRESRGELDFVEHVSQHAEDYESAANLFGVKDSHPR